MIQQIKAAADDLFPEVVRLRRTIHQHPELAYNEVATGRLVADTLAPLGLDLRTGIARTGLMATLTGARPGPTRLLRADMDALPILEANTFDYASRTPGVMHACGHDAHTASLLGAAMILHRLRDQLAGAVRFVFQPSEEKIPGGAKFMIEEGVMAGDAASDAPAVAFGQHVMPHLPTGTIGVRAGQFMASADEVYITIEGEGGHAAAPHRLQADAVYVAAQVIVALQSVISRNCPPDVPAVLSFGRVDAEGATNVIPGTARLVGTLRAMDEPFRRQAHALIERVAHHTAAAFGGKATLELVLGYPALDNHPDAARFVHDRACDYVGADNVVEADRWFAAEDFAYYLQHAPGAFYVLGTGNASAGSTHGLHTPRFTVDEDALRLAPGFMAYLAASYAP